MLKRSPFKALASIVLFLFWVQIVMTEREKPQGPHSPDRAVGTPEGLPGHLIRALESTAHFDPLPPPNPGDWLAEHPELGQTFDQFLHAPHQRPDARRSRLYLLPLGDFPPSQSPR